MPGLILQKVSYWKIEAKLFDSTDKWAETARKEILKADKSIADRKKKYWNYTEQMDNTLCQKEAMLSQPIRKEEKNVAV